ncbi:hypothetical protein [Croceicoccus mobilis]|uniref:Uncharacterized protein n=1 Tax=Croceicoccus mobilis TaxID=1703339 RepID=A0A917DQM9_9SPHN|nr:hypothetical protein [Croceicoccus mobilis]GGD60433.1 hypothetical protein GCM10010990_07350 [Croceicoccus mobilis]
MIEILAAAAEAADHMSSDEISRVMLLSASWITFYWLLPMVGGFMFASHWKAFLVWAVVLASSSLLIHLTRNYLANYYGELLGPVWQWAIVILAPTLFFALLGIFIRKTWDRRAARRAAHKVQS